MTTEEKVHELFESIYPAMCERSEGTLSKFSAMWGFVFGLQVGLELQDKQQEELNLDIENF